MSVNPDPELSLHGLSITPERPISRAEALPPPAAGFSFLRELGRGGMGVVYAAREEASGRQVAVKIIAQRLGQSPDAVERFEREARLAASISHPNCVFVYGAHVVHGAAALSMELMGGESLEERIRGKEPIPIETAVAWGIEVLDGLGAAHALGIVHRDVKPSNLFLTADGHVKVGDFGLSRSLDSDLGLTQSGAFLGSPLYSSPEQVRGRSVDHRADIYSVGATLYALITGRPPHSGSSLGDVLAQILSEEPPPPSTLRQGLPRGLEKVVMRALAKDPAKRFQDCAGFGRALFAYAPGSLTAATLGLRIGGYVIDVILVSALYQGACALLYFAGMGFGGLTPQLPWLPADTLLTRLIPTAFMVGWFAVFENRFGATLGKRLLGLRVVTVDGGRAPLWRTSLRATTFFAPSLATTLIFGIEIQPGWRIVPKMLSSFVPVVTMRKRSGYRGIHEFASGTRVLRTIHSTIGNESAKRAFDPARPAAPGAPQTIGPYRIEGLVANTPGGGMVLTARDPGLDRSVWIHLGGEIAGLSTMTRGGDSARPACLRWLHHGDSPMGHEVYESPGGASLPEYVASGRTFPWGETLLHLLSLAGELGARAEGIALEQIWMDRSGRLRVLDFAIGEGGGEAKTAVEALAGAASLMLIGVPPPAARLPEDLPAHAETTVKRLIGLAPPFAALDEASSALQSLVSRPAVISGARRGGQVALTGLWLTFIGAIFFLVRHQIHESRVARGTPISEARAQDGFAGLIMFLVMFCLPSIVLAFALRGGATFSMFGIRIRTRQHVLASRWRCLLRAAVVCLPLLALVIPVAMGRAARPAHLFMAVGLCALIYVACAIWSLMRPKRGPADFIAGTRLVPR